jgi:hypothetical protein
MANTPQAKPAEKPAKKSYRVLTNILGEQIEDDASAAEKRLSPHKLYRKGSKIELSEKDATRLLELKSIEPIK